MVRKAMSGSACGRVKRSRESSRRCAVGDAISGRSAVMRTALEVARKVARQRRRCCSRAEWNGKELVARLIHRERPRADGPFVAVTRRDSRSVLESDSSVTRKRVHRCHARQGRTVRGSARRNDAFLDGRELPSARAVKLPALQEGEVRVCWATTSKAIDVRVIAATNRDSRPTVAAQRSAPICTTDQVVAIALRRRSANDLTRVLREHERFFLESTCCAHGSHRSGISPSAIGFSPSTRAGQVRELENAHRASAGDAAKPIEASDLPSPFARAARHRRNNRRTLSVKQQTTDSSRR